VQFTKLLGTGYFERGAGHHHSIDIKNPLLPAQIHLETGWTNLEAGYKTHYTKASATINLKKVVRFWPTQLSTKINVGLRASGRLTDLTGETLQNANNYYSEIETSAIPSFLAGSGAIGVLRKPLTKLSSDLGFGDDTTGNGELNPMQLGLPIFAAIKNELDQLRGNSSTYGT
jgi:hypothetical protein